MSDAPDLDEGGESACWLDRVCPECGRLDDRPVVDRCRACRATADEAAAGPGASQEAVRPEG